MNRLKQTALCVLSAMVLNTSLWSMEESNIHSEKSENYNKKSPIINKLMLLKRLATGSLASEHSLGTGLTDITKYIGTLLCFLETKEMMQTAKERTESIYRITQDPNTLREPRNKLLSKQNKTVKEEWQIQCILENLVSKEYMPSSFGNLLKEYLEKERKERKKRIDLMLQDPNTRKWLKDQLLSQQNQAVEGATASQHEQEVLVQLIMSRFI